MDHKNTHHELRDDIKRVEPGELLEDCWFFGNLLHRKARMLRSFSDPCTTSNYAQDENFPGKSYEDTYRSIEKLPITDSKIDRQSLMRAPSVTSILEPAPSLPTSLEQEDFQDEEIEFLMGKLIRQASMNCSDTLPPKTHFTKGLTPSHSITRQRSRRKFDLRSIEIEGSEEIIRPQRRINQPKSQKSLIDLETEELQGFKDLGFDFDDKQLSPKVISMIPALQEKKDIQEDEGTSSRASRPYLSEAWGAQSYSAPPVPKWDGKRSTEDMKAQIKFWARAVASNVRQEC